MTRHGLTLAQLTLAEVQARFQDAIMGGDAEAVLRLFPGNSRTSADALFNVYRHAYMARLSSIVRSEHPVLLTYMGEESFQAMVRAYLASCPSRSPNARWIAVHLPEFLAEHAGAQRELQEIAGLERALSRAFDARDDAVLEFASLARHPPERWSRLRFIAHGSATTLTHETNAFQIWQSLKDGREAPPVAASSEPQTLLVWRHSLTARVRLLDRGEAMMWREAERGVPFGRLCELLAVVDDSSTAALRAAQYLQAWIASEALSAAELVDDAAGGC